MNTPKHKPQALLFSNCCLFFFQHAATFPPFRNFPGRLASFPPLPFLLLSSFARPSLVTECFPASDWSKKNYRHLFRPIARKNKSQSAITIEKIWTQYNGHKSGDKNSFQAWSYFLRRARIQQFLMKVQWNPKFNTSRRKRACERVAFSNNWFE